MPGAIFDLDGTLLDSNGLWAQVDDTFLARHGLKKDADYIRAVTQMEYHASAAYVAQKYQLEMTPDEVIQEWEGLSVEAYQKTVPLKVGAREVVKRLVEAGYRLALVTLSPPVLYEAALGRHGLLEDFDLTMTVPRAYENGKDPALFTDVCDQLDLRPADCLGFEDDLKALSAMAAAGMRAYAIADRRNRAQSDQYAAAGFVQRDWSAILEELTKYKAF